MQTTSVNLSRALTGGEVTWDKPKIYADWDRTGYGAVGSIDDLSDQIGRPATFEHFLDDGYPSQVTYVAGVGTPVLEVPLVNGGMGVSGYRLDRASQYFSPFRSDSPLYQYARDVAPVKLEMGAVGVQGLEYVRVFTGQMAATPLNGQQAKLQAISAARLKLAKSVQPPVVSMLYSPGQLDLGIDTGLTAAWPVTWAMHQCGVYPSPPPVSGARFWAPLHGGSAPYLPATNTEHSWFGFLYPIGYQPGNGLIQGGFQSNSGGIPYTTVPGPYVGAAYAQVGSSLTTLLIGGPSLDDQLEPGADFFSQAGNTGRIQFYARGDAAAINTIPGGSGALAYFIGPPFIAGVTIYTDPPLVTTPYVTVGIRAVDRKPFIQLYDGATTTTLASASVFPTDSAWHFFGAAWDVSSSKLWLNVDGTVTTTTGAMVTSNLPANNQAGLENDFVFSARSVLPISEFQFSSGYAASPAHLATWMYNSGWTQTATAYPSSVKLVALAEPIPREAWELIASFAQAELASLRTDENDNVLYLPLPWWALAAQQVTAETLTQTRHTGKTSITYDPTTIRNSVTVRYTASSVDGVETAIYTQTSPLGLRPGVTEVVFQLANPVVRIQMGYLTILSANQISGVDTTDPGLFYVSFNTAIDGSGTYADVGFDLTGVTVRAQVTAWTAGAVLVEFTNATSSVQYVTNNSNGTFAYLSLGGFVLRQTSASKYVADADSIAARGERNLDITLGEIQTEAMAQSMASALLGDLAQPKPTIDNLEAFADPRRQPGDLVSFSDADNTGVSGLWRYRGIKHNIDAAVYTQTLQLRRGYLVGVWDTDTWGDVIWGE